MFNRKGAIAKPAPMDLQRRWGVQTFRFLASVMSRESSSKWIDEKYYEQRLFMSGCYSKTRGPVHKIRALGGGSLSLACALSQSWSPWGTSDCRLRPTPCGLSLQSDILSAVVEAGEAPTTTSVLTSYEWLLAEQCSPCGSAPMLSIFPTVMVLKAKKETPDATPLPCKIKANAVFEG
ncbi:hypothetical protein MDA_GLEAN10008929 [Myotis davidii]|uniref:Uncharacterized protein n=1 Tax=Myotis davidii TaxID=225400 RepID=L5M5C1_MYODS|nr:hypothetical protein MDA_GLEAN10008929 [Myotis davidii]